MVTSLRSLLYAVCLTLCLGATACRSPRVVAYPAVLAASSSDASSVAAVPAAPSGDTSPDTSATLPEAVRTALRNIPFDSAMQRLFAVNTWLDTAQFACNYPDGRDYWAYERLWTALPAAPIASDTLTSPVLRPLRVPLARLLGLYASGSTDTLLARFAEQQYFQTGIDAYAEADSAGRCLLLDHERQSVQQGTGRTPYRYLYHLMAGKHTLRQGQPVAALACLDSAVACCSRLREPHDLALLYAWQTAAYARLGDTTAMARSCRLALTLHPEAAILLLYQDMPAGYQRSWHPEPPVTAQPFWADSNWLINRYQRTLNAYESFWDFPVMQGLLQQADSLLLEQRYFTTVANACNQLSPLRRADCLTHVREVMFRHGLRSPYRYLYHRLQADYHLATVHDAEACVELRQALDAVRPLDDTTAAALLTYKLSQAYTRLGYTERLDSLLATSQPFAEQPYHDTREYLNGHYIDFGLQQAASYRLHQQYAEARQLGQTALQSFPQRFPEALYGNTMNSGAYAAWAEWHLETARACYALHDYAVADSLLSVYLDLCLRPDTTQTFFRLAYPQDVAAVAAASYCRIGYLQGEAEYLRRLAGMNPLLATRALDCFASQPEGEREAQWQQLQGTLGMLHYAGLRRYASPRMASAAYDYCLRARTLSLSLQRVGDRLVRLSADSMVARCRHELHRQYQQWAQHGQADSVRQQAALRIHTLERQIQTRLGGLAESLAEVNLTHWQQVREALQPTEAAIEVVAAPDIEHPSEATHYYALLIRHDSASPQIVPLCSESELAQLLQPSSQGHQRHIDQLYDWQQQGAALHACCMAPLWPLLSGVSRCYVAKTGHLNRLNLAAIPCSATERVMDRLMVCDVSSTAEVLNPRSTHPPYRSVCLYGGLDYYLSADTLRHYCLPYPAPDAVRASHLPAADVPRDALAFLAGSLDETDSLRAVCAAAGCHVSLLQGARGVEPSVRALDGHAPSILHFATHAFYLAEGDTLPHPDPFVPASPDRTSHTESLLRTGLHMAGSAAVWLGAQPAEGLDDGLLTAAEIARLDLSGTSLAVLSACNSGLGLIDATDGIIGLQRGFKRAGVQSLVMSLWPVPDHATMHLMIAFYRALLSGTERHEALATAVQTLRQDPRYTAPHYWAGFVLLD